MLNQVPRRRKWLKQKPGQKKTPIQETVKFGGGSVMVWGAISTRGVGPLKFIDEKLTGGGYVALLEGQLLPYVENLGLEDWVFQQDNDPKHVCNLARQFYQDQGLTLFEWPACSPDLNPIEHAWALVKQLLVKSECRTKADLRAATQAAWGSIPAERIRALIHSMPSRLAEVIKAKGGHTRY